MKSDLTGYIMPSVAKRLYPSSKPTEWIALRGKDASLGMTFFFGGANCVKSPQ
jgi:hypothetical protein